MYRDDSGPERRPGAGDGGYGAPEFPRWTPEEYRQRPVEFDPGRAEAIISRVANGESLSTICLDRDMPLPATFLRWMRGEPDYARMFQDAQSDRADVLAEEMLLVGRFADPRVGKLEYEARRFHTIAQNPGKYSERSKPAGDKPAESGAGSPDYSGELRRKIEGMAKRYAEENPKRERVS